VADATIIIPPHDPDQSALLPHQYPPSSGNYLSRALCWSVENAVHDLPQSGIFPKQHL
jgi:hypothetical protein